MKDLRTAELIRDSIDDDVSDLIEGSECHNSNVLSVGGGCSRARLFSIELADMIAEDEVLLEDAVGLYEAFLGGCAAGYAFYDYRFDGAQLDKRRVCGLRAGEHAEEVSYPIRTARRRRSDYRT